MSQRVQFPANFLWGAATSAYQIEGSPLADGAGPSIWQRFAHTPGMMSGGDTGDIACDHYKLWKSDIALMKELGLKAYRFSISWSRVMPQGRGRVNPAGLGFYDRSSMACSRTASSRWRRCSIGICRQPWMIAAAGLIQISPPGSPTTRTSCTRPLMVG